MILRAKIQKQFEIIILNKKYFYEQENHYHRIPDIPSPTRSLSARPCIVLLK